MKQLIAFLLFFSFSAHAQLTVKGIVKNAKTGEPLAFANITLANKKNIITDIDGKFEFRSKAREAFTVSYVGYIPRKIIAEAAKNYYVVPLFAQAQDLKEVVVGGENPVHALMRKVIAAKSRNNPQEHLSSFEFKAYNKLVITADPDSISSKIDSVFIEKYSGREFSKMDSTNYKFKKTIARQHLFQTEKVSQFQFTGHKLKETILGTKMAGFTQPVYEVIAFNLQSFSVYDKSYELFETKYHSPIAEDSFTYYSYKLLDTLSVGSREAYLVYFKPKRKKKAAGLQGLLYVDAENFAVAKAVMRIRGVLDITAVHDFDYLEAQKIWFPVSKEFRIVKGKNQDDIRILGETFRFDPEDDNILTPRKKQNSDFTYVLSKTKYFGLNYNVPVKIKNPSIAIEITDDAVKRPDDFWQPYRQDSLDIRSPRTYFALDSVAKKEKIEKKLRIGRKILNGYIPLGPIDLDLRYLLSYNNYEGFRVGLGGITSEKFSRKFKIDGYTAYGTKDGMFKYSIGASARTGKFSNTWIGGSYTDDIREIASSTFAIDKRVFKIYDPRPINVSTFYGYQSWRGYIETKFIPKTESIWQLNHSEIDPLFDYFFLSGGKLFNAFDLTTAMVSLQWNPFSDYMQTPTGRLEVEKRFPKFTFQFTQSLPGLMGSDFKFAKVDFRTEYQKKFLNGQKSAVLFEAGYASGDVPITHLYNTSPNNLTKDKILQRITFSGKNSFETMYFNEFFSSQYAMLQLKHGFKRITLFKKVRPELVLVSRMAYGTMENPQQHFGLVYKTLDKGFFESGIELNQIYQSFGLTGFYRYGPNQLPKFEDNIAVKLSFVLDLGI